MRTRRYSPPALAFLYQQLWIAQELRKFNDMLVAQYFPRFGGDMEKRGVVDGENEAPATKEAADKRCGGGCGKDTLSKMADVVTGAHDQVAAEKRADAAQAFEKFPNCNTGRLPTDMPITGR